ncbi:MAG: YihY/virulence factor BrkB family protein [Hyphomicrobiaceae bacterium]
MQGSVDQTSERPASAKGRWMTPEPRSWWRVLKRTATDFVDDQILLIAAGVTFYGLLALIPALAALIALYGLFFDPSDVAHHVSMLSGFLPSEAVSIIADQSQRIAAQSKSTLGAAFVIGLAISLWSAMSGVTAIFSGLNVAYGEREKRSFVWLYTQALLFTLGALVFLLLALAGLAVVPVVIDVIGESSMLTSILDIGRWPAMVAVLVFVLAVLYRFGPSREHPRWRFIVFGTAAATLGWVAFSLLFSWYVTNIASYNRTYGSLGALIAFMTWMWLSTTIVLLGAELNAKVESETRRVKPAE